MKIDLCKKFTKVNKFEKRLFIAFPDASVRVKSCIGGVCGKCKHQAAAKVDGLRVKAKKITKAIEKIKHSTVS